MNNIYQEIIDEGNEILEKGLGHLRSRTRTYAPVSPVKKYAPHEIKALREKSNYTQSFFGKILGVSPKTVYAWESGANNPPGTALRTFQILEQDPHALDKYIFIDAT